MRRKSLSMPVWKSCFVLVILTSWLGHRSATARDHFLTIGGGYSPAGNQVSLEKNVLLFQRFLTEAYPSGANHDILFSDGNNPNRDIVFQSDDLEIPRHLKLLAAVFDKTKYQTYQYRDHQISGLRSGSSRVSMNKWFDEEAKKLQSGDRLFIYITAHGGRGDKKNTQNTGLYAWNAERIPMQEFVSQLDKVPEGVSIATVMVQCYSGGFANLIYDDGDVKKGLSKANRCGFFATVHDRVAAGCTPDINEENYREYSSYFWEALRGQTRTGQKIERPDYDQDGQVTLAEAHAYTQLTSTTIDICVKTSDVFLRKYSRTQDKQQKDLFTADTDYETLLAAADENARRVLQGLSEQLELKSNQRGKEAKAVGDAAIKKKKELDGKKSSKLAEASGIRKGIAKHVINRWPELANPWHPYSAEIVRENSAAIVKHIESHPNFKRFEQRVAEAKGINDQRFELEKKWVKCQRMIRTLENVALAANLPKVADDVQQQRFAQLLIAESGTLGEQNDSPALTSQPDLTNQADPNSQELETSGAE